MRRTLLLTIGALLFVVVTLGTTLFARQPRPGPDVLAALLTEVRGLRAAMETMASAGPRIQLAMGRLQLQEQRINTLVRRLDDVRDRRVSTEADFERAKAKLGDIQQALRQGGPADPGLEQERKHLQAAMSEISQNLRRFQNEESALAQEVMTEQGRWSEINQRLEELDRALGGR
jgi:DNA repair exonuclease SbcCD ATPase subunit